MVDIAVEEGAKVAWGVLKPIAGFLAAAAVGFGAAELLEHRGPGPTVHLPFGITWHPFGESLEAKLDDYIAGMPAQVAAARKAGLDQQSKADAPYFDSWAKRVAADDAALKQARDDAAKAVTKQDQFTNVQAAQAFRLGQASCGAPNATQNIPGIIPGPGPGGVSNDAPGDFAALFEPGAFTPAP